jgi:hypothetical protein
MRRPRARAGSTEARRPAPRAAPSRLSRAALALAAALALGGCAAALARMGTALVTDGIADAATPDRCGPPRLEMMQVDAVAAQFGGPPLVVPDHSGRAPFVQLAASPELIVNDAGVRPGLAASDRDIAEYAHRAIGDRSWCTRATRLVAVERPPRTCPLVVALVQCAW